MSYFDKGRKKATIFAKGLHQFIASVCRLDTGADNRRAAIEKRRLTVPIFEHVPLVAKSLVTAIAVGPGAIDQHAGILYYDRITKQVKLTHHAWHSDFRCHQQDPIAYGFVRADTTSVDDELIAAACNNLEAEFLAGGIAYALNYSATLAAAGGVEYLRKYGATCTTFIMVAFSHAGITLIDDSDWPTGRPGDDEIQRETVDLLRANKKVSPAHLAAQEALVGKAKRFRPIEVAAAAYMAGSSPNTFKYVSELADDIQREYNAVFSP